MQPASPTLTLAGIAKGARRFTATLAREALLEHVHRVETRLAGEQSPERVEILCAVLGEVTPFEPERDLVFTGLARAPAMEFEAHDRSGQLLLRQRYGEPTPSP